MQRSASVTKEAGIEEIVKRANRGMSALDFGKHRPHRTSALGTLGQKT